LIDVCERFGPRSRLVAAIVKALDTANDHVPEKARAVLCRFGNEAFEIVLEEGSLLDRGRGHLGHVLLSYPDANERLLAAAKDRKRSGRQRRCALAALVANTSREGGLERDCLLPHLIELLDEEDKDVLRETVGAMHRFGERLAGAVPVLARLLDHPDEHIRADAIRALAESGSAARELLPRIRPLVRDSFWPVDREAKRFVERFAGADLIEDIRASLQSEDVTCRARAVRLLGERPQEFPDLLDLFRRALGDPSAAVQSAALVEGVKVKWPAGIDPQPFFREALNILLQRLRTGDAEARASSIRLFATNALQSPETLAAICAALEDEADEVRQAAVQVLRNDWRPLPAEALPGLLRLVRTDMEYPGVEAAALLLEAQPRPADLVPALRDRLRRAPGHAGHAGHTALDALNRLGYIPSEDELPLLVPALDESVNHTSVVTIALLLARMGAVAIPHLIAHLDQPNASLVVLALGRMGPIARPALPALGNLIHHEWNFVRGTAVDAIIAIGTPAEIVPLLLPAFRDRDGSLRGKLLEACGELGAAARPWLPELMHLVRTEDSPEDLRPGDLAQALAGLAVHTPEIVGLLSQALGEPGTARTNAISALATMGPRAAEAVPQLEALFAQAEGQERQVLEQALGQIQGARASG
jgi:HEAT repeat protein